MSLLWLCSRLELPFPCLYFQQKCFLGQLRATRSHGCAFTTSDLESGLSVHGTSKAYRLYDPFLWAYDLTTDEGGLAHTS
jgi:hypothetical protein